MFRVFLVGEGYLITATCRGYQGTLHSDACKYERYMHFFLPKQQEKT